MPLALAELWSQVPPDLPSLKTYVRPVVEWLENSASAGDYVLIQGDFGACHLLVLAAFARGLVPVYATTRRVVSESRCPDGAVEMIRKFGHVMFRRYGE
jgi:hypothetical protein